MKVLITGANGHLGLNLVETFRTAGHTVRASVRDADNRRKTEHLKRIGDFDIVSATLEDQPSLRRAMEDQDVLVHAAAVYEFAGTRSAQDIISASVDGIRNAFTAAKDAGIKKVVLTSSVATLPLRAPDEPPADETMWQRDWSVPYLRAKTEGEQTAWRIAEDLGLSLTTILPGAFAGPGFVTPTPTIDFIDAILKGALGVAAPNITYPYCDVRDIARAHLLAAENDVTGRFITTNTPVPHVSDIARAMRSVDPSVRTPKLTLPRFALSLVAPLDNLNSKLVGAKPAMTAELARTMSRGIYKVTAARAERELGWTPQITMEQSLKDTIKALRARREQAA